MLFREKTQLLFCLYRFFGKDIAIPENTYFLIFFQQGWNVVFGYFSASLLLSTRVEVVMVRGM